MNNKNGEWHKAIRRFLLMPNDEFKSKSPFPLDTILSCPQFTEGNFEVPGAVPNASEPL